MVVRPAAFGRLRVETPLNFFAIVNNFPAAFGRLRVETNTPKKLPPLPEPAAFGRLRVETAYRRCTVTG